MKAIEFIGYFILALFIGGIIVSFAKLVISFFGDRYKNLHHHGRLSHR